MFELVRELSSREQTDKEKYFLELGRHSVSILAQLDLDLALQSDVIID